MKSLYLRLDELEIVVVALRFGDFVVHEGAVAQQGQPESFEELRLTVGLDETQV